MKICQYKKYFSLMRFLKCIFRRTILLSSQADVKRSVKVIFVTIWGLVILSLFVVIGKQNKELNATFHSFLFSYK